MFAPETVKALFGELKRVASPSAASASATWRKTGEQCFPVTKELVGPTVSGATGAAPQCAWQFVQALQVGQGAFASVVGACCRPGDCGYVAKYVQFKRPFPYQDTAPEAFEKEVAAQAYCASRGGVCPPVLRAWMCEHGGVLIMPALQTSLARLLAQASHGTPIALLPQDDRLLLVNLILDGFYTMKRFHLEVGYAHNDLHAGNILANSAAEPQASGAPQPSAWERYLKAAYRFYIIDLADATPLPSAEDVQKERQRARATGRDFAQLRASIEEILAPFLHVIDDSGQPQNVLEVLFEVVRDHLYLLDKQQVLALLAEDTTYLSPSLFAPPEQSAAAATAIAAANADEDVTMAAEPTWFF